MPPVTHGSLRTPEAAVALVGLLVTSVLIARRVTGAIVIGILASATLAFAMGVASLPKTAWVSVPSFATVGQADVMGAIRSSALPMLLPVLLVDFFDTIGTATAIADEAGLHDERGEIPASIRLTRSDDSRPDDLDARDGHAAIHQLADRVADGHAIDGDDRLAFAR